MTISSSEIEPIFAESKYQGPYNEAFRGGLCYPTRTQQVLLYRPLQLVQCLGCKRCCWPRRDSMSDDETGPGRDFNQAALNAPSAEQAAAVLAHEEDDDVAYDDEPDEADGEGSENVEKEAEHPAGQIQDQVQCPHCSLTQLEFALISLLS